MTLVATPGDTAQNSYATVEEADNYFENRSHSEEWSEIAEETDKEKILITSSNQLDWYLDFKGSKTDSEQPLQWPRKDVIRKDGTIVDSAITPRDMKVATFEMALSSLAEDRTNDDPLAGLEQIKASSLSIKANVGNYPQTNAPVIPGKIKGILSDLIINAGGVVRLMRA